MKKPVRVGKISHNIVQRIVDNRIRAYRMTCCSREYRVVRIKPIWYCGKIVGMAREEIDAPTQELAEGPSRGPVSGGGAGLDTGPAPSPIVAREVSDSGIGGD